MGYDARFGISNHCTPLLSQHTQQVTGVGIPQRATAQAASPKTTSGHTPQSENHAKRLWQDHTGGTVEGSPKTPPKKQRPEIKMSPEKSRSIAGAAAIATLTAGAKGENTSPDEPTTAHLEASDWPTVVPRAGMVDLHDPVVQLNLAFKMRALRDGGGKPSGSPRAADHAFFFGALGAAILTLSQEWIEPMKLSLSCGEKQHPFPESLLSQVREVLGSSPGETPPYPTIRSTTLPPAAVLIGRKIRGPRSWFSRIAGQWSPLRCDFSHSHIRSMATEVWTVWRRSCPWGFSHTHRSSQLQFRERLCFPHQEDLCWRRGHGHGHWTTHQNPSSRALPLLRGRSMSWASGCNRWRGQDPHDLRWLLWIGQQAHTEQHYGKDHSTHSVGLCPCAPLAAWSKQLSSTFLWCTGAARLSAFEAPLGSEIPSAGGTTGRGLFSTPLAQ